MKYFKEIYKNGFIVDITLAEANYLESTGDYLKTVNKDITIFFLK